MSFHDAATPEDLPPSHLGDPSDDEPEPEPTEPEPDDEQPTHFGYPLTWGDEG